MISGILSDLFIQLKRFIKKPTRVLQNATNVGSGLIGALVIYTIIILISNCKFPVVVVLSGSMEPGIYRGDILLIRKTPSIQVGEIVVYNDSLHKIPIVHRVHQVHPQDDGSTLLLTKGDNNRVNDRGLYAHNKLWLSSNDVIGKTYAIIPRLGMPTIWINEIKHARTALIALIIFGLVIGKEF